MGPPQSSFLFLPLSSSHLLVFPPSSPPLLFSSLLSSSLLSSIRNALDNDLDTWSARESLDLFARETLEGAGEDSNAASALTKAAALLGVLI